VSSAGFSKRRILSALSALADELGQRGVRGKLFVVRGAAMVLAYSARRSTRDVDAIFEPKSSIYDAARAVAERAGLPDDWLDDAVKAFAPGEDPNSRVIFSTDSLVSRE